MEGQDWPADTAQRQNKVASRCHGRWDLGWAGWRLWGRPVKEGVEVGPTGCVPACWNGARLQPGRGRDVVPLPPRRMAEEVSTVDVGAL